jgi:hypothetical protein
MLDRPGVLIRRWREPEMLHFCDLVCRGGETIRVSVVRFRPLATIPTRFLALSESHLLLGRTSCRGIIKCG